MTQSPSGPEPGNDPKAQAKADKAYAKAMRPWYKKKRFIIPLAVIVLAIAGSALGGGGDDVSSANDEPTSSSVEPSGSEEQDTSKKEAPKEKKVEVVQVPAGDLLKEFEGNELAADSKYKGKRLQVTGVVEKIDTDLFDDSKYILQIGSGGDFEITFVSCHDIDTDSLSTVNKGDDVTVVGDFDDGGDLGVELTNCELQ